MIEVFKQMVEALENSVDLVIEDAYHAEQIYANVPTRQTRVGGLKLLAEKHQKAIKAGKQAIAELESQGKTMKVEGPLHVVCQCDKCKQLEEQAYDLLGQLKVANLKLSARSQRTWVGLTEEDLKLLSAEWRIVYGAWMDDFAKEIEAKLKQKNGFAEEKNS